MPSTPTIHRPAIHWVGAGLSSGPGIVALARKWGEITIWDSELDRAEVLKVNIPETSKVNLRLLNLEEATSRNEFCAALNPGDVVVSMLPPAFHVRVSKLALAENCHMVTSSYLTHDMVALNEEAMAKGLSLVNEVGLDPGIDHLMAYFLVDNAREAGILGQGHAIDFISYCGGIPVENTPFTYKFSWTPLGVLTALKNPAQMIKEGAKYGVAKVWDDIGNLDINGENFEVYPNRDSLPYIREYGLDGETNLRTFVRGTLRLEGWKEAWKDIFTTIDQGQPSDLKTLSDTLWQKYQYQDGEQDRVLLHVGLTATREDGTMWEAYMCLDHSGSDWQSAMATCVSLTVAEAVGAVIEARLSPGVQPTPHDITEVKKWLQGLKQNGIMIKGENVDFGVSR